MQGIQANTDTHIHTHTHTHRQTYKDATKRHIHRYMHICKLIYHIHLHTIGAENSKQKPDFSGKWKLQRFENFEEYMKTDGINAAKRKIAMTMMNSDRNKPVQTIKQVEFLFFAIFFVFFLLCMCVKNSFCIYAYEFFVFVCVCV